MRLNYRIANHWWREAHSVMHQADYSSNHGDYWDGYRLSQRALLDMYRCGLRMGYYTDFYYETYWNIKLNHENLKHIHIRPEKPKDYLLMAFLPDTDGDWYNDYSIDDSLKNDSSIFKALNDYYQSQFSVVSLNIDMKLRAKYGSLGWIAIKDFNLEDSDKYRWKHEKELFDEIAPIYWPDEYR